MSLSKLVFALTIILYGAINLGVDASMNIVYWGLIVGGVLWIIEGVGVWSWSTPRRRVAE